MARFRFGWICLALAGAMACGDNGSNGDNGGSTSSGSASGSSGSGGSTGSSGGTSSSGSSSGGSGTSSGSTSGGSGGSSGGTSSGGPDGGSSGGCTNGGGTPPPPFAGVFTQHNDNARSGQNLSETVLTTANVNASQFGKLFCWAVDDQVYTQALLVPGVMMAGGKHDVVYVGTMNDTVYAFDANDTAANMPLWSKSFLGAGVVPVRNSDTKACGGNYQDITGNIGILGTPVIDPTAGTMYLVARTKENGSTYVQRLHALDIRDGSERPGSPVVITATAPGTGDGGSTVSFDPLKNNQRAALLLDSGVVYVAWSSHCDWGPYHGWLLGYDAQTLKQVVTYTSTPDGGAGGIWMAGQGPASDGQGSLYLVTGNGTVGSKTDPGDVTNRGESFLRLTRSGSTLTVASWFTPHEYMRMEAGDLDLGSAGALLVPDSNLIIGGGKPSKLYSMDRMTMGGLGTVRTEPSGIQTVKLGALHLHGGPGYWNGPGGPLVYTWAEYDHLKSYRLDTTTSQFDPVPLAVSANPAPDGMPGAFFSVSANGSTEGTGILWAYLPEKGNANQLTVVGQLHAFDAANVGVELWNSAQNEPRDGPGNLAKFTSPTVANGRVYLPTFSNTVCVYGLLPNVQPLGAPTALSVTPASKTSATLQWTSNSTGETSFAIERKEGFLGFEQIAMAPQGATSFTDTTVQPFGAYSYRVRALGQPAPSAYSNTACTAVDTGSMAPRLRVTGMGHPISSGSTVASWGTDTDFGGSDMGAKASHTFTLENVGTAALNVTGNVSVGGANAGDFVVDTPPPASIAPGATATLGISFAPTAVGVRTATIQIPSDDPNQSPYTFAVSGITTGDLVGWWKLDETSGTTAADASGAQNAGTANGIAWVAGHTGGAAAFDGMTSAIVVSENVSLDPYALTIAAWVNPADWTGNHRIAQKGAFDDQYRLTAENGMLKFDIAQVGSVMAGLPPTNTWSHVAGTYDGTNLRLYMDGNEVASTPATAPMPESPDALTIGCKPANPSPTEPPVSASDHFHGMLDEVHVYGRALSAAEISTLAQ